LQNHIIVFQLLAVMLVRCYVSWRCSTWRYRRTAYDRRSTEPLSWFV